MKRLSRPRLILAGVLGALVLCVLCGWGFHSWRYQRRAHFNQKLIQAVLQGNETRVDVAANVGANVNAYFDTRTHLPVPEPTFWESLVARFAGQRLMDKTHTAPVLSLAVSYGHKEIVENLLIRQANVDAPDGLGSTPLMYAANHNERDILLDLLDHHADVNHKNRDGNTALHLAVTQKNLVNCQLLMERGADPNAANALGQTPLDNVAVLAADVHRQWLFTYADALASPPSASPPSPVKPSPAPPGVPLLPEHPAPALITRHYQHQLDLLRPLITLLEKHGARPSAETQRLLIDNFLLDPKEAQEGLEPQVKH